MKVYLGLGSNEGERRDNLARAIDQLKAHGLNNVRISPVVESPAWLPERAPSQWNRPFLNLVLEAEYHDSLVNLRHVTKSIQHALGREDISRWAPRIIDIDMLIVGDEVTELDGVRFPAPELHRRAFVLTPLIHLRPNFVMPGSGTKTVFEQSLQEVSTIPLWMGIVNVTPDSFSDGGERMRWEHIEPLVARMLESGVHIIDVGAESTRPGAIPLTPDDEWTRLQPVLDGLAEMLRALPLPPQISVDTRHPDVAAKALEQGVDVINDVSGLSSAEMMGIARDSDASWVAMHSLSIPASAKIMLSKDADPVDEVAAWLSAQLERWDAQGLDLTRLIFDPGIGFGKSSIQSLRLLRNIGRFRAFGLRVLVGHSRKSFMRAFSEPPAAERDLETIGSSLQLCQQGVDMLRVHDVPSHARAYLAWAHLNND